MSRFSLLSIFIAVLSLALAGGCADDLRSRNLFDAGAGEAVIRFSVENISLTRGDGEEEKESLIDNAYLLFYAHDASLQSASPLAAVKAEVSENALTFKMPLSLQPNTDYQLVAIANADGFVPAGFNSFADYLQSWSNTESSAKGELLLQNAGRIVATTTDRIPMRGRPAEDAPFRFSIQNGVYSVSATLTFRRAVARIDVSNMVKEGFEVEGVALCNWRDAATASVEEGELGNRLGKVCGILTGENGADVEFIDMPETGADGTQQLQKAIYCFPSATYDSYPTDNESTALIIKARYGDDAESSYYRVNVGASGNKSIVKANTKYTVAIQSVKGRGASSAGEAYASEESPIVLSVVEDWDLEGNFAMDENGNFIVLSRGYLEFDGEDVSTKEVKVLTSKGLGLTASFIADSEGADNAFIANLISSTPLSTLQISPSGKNTGESPIGGVVRIIARPEGGKELYVDVKVVQNVSGGGSDEPIIPDDMPFALIPESYDRVKVNHIDKTIEIDGFDPGCFNSFIDVPFKVYIKDGGDAPTSVKITTTLEWPLEGRISGDPANTYCYCQQSFEISGVKKVSTLDGTLIDSGEIGNKTISISDGQRVYISIGAMGPDDPAIVRDIYMIGANGEQINYTLTAKPRPVIIDDVILSKGDNEYWLVQDRNIQNYLISDVSLREYIGLDSQGRKRQAYNYSLLPIKADNKDVGLQIPFKLNEDNSNVSEKQHILNQGVVYKYTSRYDLSYNSATVVARLPWLKKYSYSDGMERHSPFYESESGQYNYEKWIFPTQSIMELISGYIRVSKMRMYLMSEIPVEASGNQIPVCCYIPYSFNSTLGIEDVSYDTVYGYYVSPQGVDPEAIIILTFNQTKGVLKTVGNTNRYALSRLVRPLTTEELEMYKTEYLGYGSEPYRLTICHPDTYESTSSGWIPY